MGQEGKKKSQTVGVLLLDDEQAPILVDVFKRDKRLKVCSIKLVSDVVQCDINVKAVISQVSNQPSILIRLGRVAREQPCA